MSALQLGVTVFVLNALGFGNGPALFALLQGRLVEEEGLLTPDQLLYAFAVARVTPGPANVYVAAVGYFGHGPPGAALAMVAILLPGYLILPLLGLHARMRHVALVRRFTRGLTATSVGLLVAAAASLGRQTLTSIPAGVAFALALAMVAGLKWNPIVSLVLAALVGWVLHLAW